MNVFVLHAGEPELMPFLRRLQVPAGTAVPRWEKAEQSSPIFVVNCREVSRAAAAAVRKGLRIIQSPEAMGRALERELWTTDLSRHGIPAEEDTAVGRSKARLMRKYIVPVFQLESLGVFTTGDRSGLIGRLPASSLIDAEGEPGHAPRPTILRRAANTAVRSVYVLGLDYGVVTMVSGADGLLVVESIEASPKAFAEPFAERFAQAVNRLEAAGAAQAPILLGMDPEFVLRRPGPAGKIVSASKYFPRRGRVGCDSVRIGDRLIYPLAELRPSPAAEPAELFRNLYAAMRLAAARIDDASLEWLAGGMPAKGLPLGGHIHISGVPLNAELLRALDNYLALPLVLLEDSTTKRRRPKYGALGDFRRQFHGGFEYRTLPSWIVSPAVAMGVIATARVICEHYRELLQRPLARPEAQIDYYEGNKEAIRPLVKGLWHDLEQTVAYQRYRKPLNRLKSAIDRMEPWNEQQDVRVLWKIPPF